MATIIERAVSQSGKDGDQKSDGLLRYTVVIDIDSETEQDAWDLLDATIPDTHRGMSFKDTTIEPQGAGVFYFDVSYADGDEDSNEPKEEGDTAITFDSTGGSEKITQARATTTFVVPGQTAPDFKGGINVTKSSVDGVEIVVPVWKCTGEKLFTTSQVNALIDTWRRMTGKVNSGEFVLDMGGVIQTFSEGELRFDGIRGSRKSVKKGTWSITFNFAGSPTVDVDAGDSPLLIGDIEVTYKRGWDYLWISYTERTDANALIRVPRAAYVAKVYAYADFTELGI